MVPGYSVYLSDAYNRAGGSELSCYLNFTCVFLLRKVKRTVSVL